jgi:uracil-DNA glycosylase family 4
MNKPCNICEYKLNKKLPYRIIKSDFMILGESPSEEDLSNRNYFTDLSGKFFIKALNYAGLNINDFILANCMCCRIDRKNDSIKKINSGLNNCLNYLRILFDKIKPKIIIAVGAVAFKQLTGVQKINENRGRFFKVKLEKGRKSLGKIVNDNEYDFIVFPILNPQQIVYKSLPNILTTEYYSLTPNERILFDDLANLANFIKTGKPIEIKTDDYLYIKDKDLPDSLKYFSFDLETTDIRIYNNNCKLICASLCWENGKSKIYVFDNNENRDKFIKLMTDYNIKFVANRPFDEIVLREKLGIKINGLIFDVFTMAHLVDENQHISLEGICNAFTDLKNIKDLANGVRSNLQNADSETLRKYSGVDADGTLRAGITLLKIIKKDEYLYNYLLNFINPVQDMLVDVNKNGVLIDTKKLKENEEEIYKIINNLEKDALRLIPKPILLAHVEKGLKLSRNELVADYLFKNSLGLKLKPVQFTDKTNEPAITESHLKNFSDKSFIQLYMRWKKAQKIATTYFKQLWENIYPDNRIYPSIVLYRTTTGRTVMLNPAIQTFPKRGEWSKFIREVIVPDKGWILGERDLSQSEIRIMGWVAGDKAILDALKQGIDLHTKTASVINNVPIDKVTKDMRQKAKAINFGFLYGMQAKGFKQYAKDEYDIDINDEEAEIIRKKFFQEYNSLPKFYENVIKECETFGYVRGILGRKRRLPQIYDKNKFIRSEAERQAINFKIQNFSSDLGLLGMYLFWKKIKDLNLEHSIKPFWFIHDAIMFQAKKEIFDEAMMLLKECMEVETKKYIKEKFGIDIEYPIASEGKYSETNWAEMLEYKN